MYTPDFSLLTRRDDMTGGTNFSSATNSSLAMNVSTIEYDWPFVQTLGRCQLAFDDVCFAPKRGEFGGDADISGPGVFYSMLTMVITVMVICLISLSTELGMWLIFTKKMEKLHGLLKARESKRHVYESILIAIGDTQMITAFAFCATIFTEDVGCKISQYHFHVVHAYVLTAAFSHLMAVVVIHDYFYHVLGLIRMVFFVILALIFVFLDLGRSTVTFSPVSEPGSNSTTTLVIPAICATRGNSLDTFGRAIPSAGLAHRVFTNREQTYSSVSSNLYLFAAIYILYAVFGGVQILVGQTKPELKTPTWHTVTTFFRLAGVGACTGVAAANIDNIRILRKWMDKSGWIAPDESEVNTWSFGQYVPIFMLITVAMGAVGSIETWCCARKKRKAQKNGE